MWVSILVLMLIQSWLERSSQARKLIFSPMGDEIQPSKKRAAGREISQDNPGLDDEEDVQEEEMGTFKKASDEVLASRRIVKVRRQQTSVEPSAPSSNPFAGIRLVPPPAPAAQPVNATTDAQAAEAVIAGEAPDGKDDTNSDDVEVTSKESEVKEVDSSVDKEKAVVIEQEVEADHDGDPSNTAEETSEPKPTDGSEEKTAETALADDGKQAEENKAVGSGKEEIENPDAEKGGDGSAEKTAETEPADENKTEINGKEENTEPDASASGGAPLSSFQQLSNSQNAFTGFAGTGFSSSSFSFGSIQKDGSPSQSSLPTFSFGASNNGTSTTSIFGTTAASIGVKSEGSAFRPMQEVPRETGEENEETVFSAESALFEFFDGGWKERGKGEVKLNVLKTDTQKARLVMRAKGNLRLILNASLYLDMKLTKMDKKGISFACVNTATEGKDGLSTFALKFKDVGIVEEFCSAVSAHKDKPAVALKTPENSPKTSDN